MKITDWDKISENYYREIISPIKDAEKNSPLLKELKKTRGKKAIDIGCGTGALIPIISKKFDEVTAIDYSSGMIKQARKVAPKNTTVKKANMTNLNKYKNFDVAFSINSLLAKDIKSLNQMLKQINKTIKKGGKFIAVMPSMESYLYQIMLVMENYMAKGMSQNKAKKKAMEIFYEDDFDFVQGLTHFQKQTQKCLYRFEITHRLKKAGFKEIKIEKLRYKWKSWNEAGHYYFPKEESPWDWFVTCKKN